MWGAAAPQDADVASRITSTAFIAVASFCQRSAAPRWIATAPNLHRPRDRWRVTDELTMTWEPAMVAPPTSSRSSKTGRAWPRRPRGVIRSPSLPAALPMRSGSRRSTPPVTAPTSSPSCRRGCVSRTCTSDPTPDRAATPSAATQPSTQPPPEPSPPPAPASPTAPEPEPNTSKAASSAEMPWVGSRSVHLARDRRRTRGSRFAAPCERFSWVALRIHDGLDIDPIEGDWVRRFRAASGLSVGGWGVLRTEPEREADLAHRATRPGRARLLHRECRGGVQVQQRRWSEQ